MLVGFNNRVKNNKSSSENFQTVEKTYFPSLEIQSDSIKKLNNTCAVNYVNTRQLP